MKCLLHPDRGAWRLLVKVAFVMPAKHEGTLSKNSPRLLFDGRPRRNLRNLEKLLNAVPGVILTSSFWERW